MQLLLINLLLPPLSFYTSNVMSLSYLSLDIHRRTTNYAFSIVLFVVRCRGLNAATFSFRPHRSTCLIGDQPTLIHSLFPPLLRKNIGRAFSCGSEYRFKAFASPKLIEILTRNKIHPSTLFISFKVDLHYVLIVKSFLF